MDHIGLADTIKALREELAAAIAAGEGEGLYFPVGNTQLECHVGVTKAGDVKGKVKFWVVELGGGGSYANEQIQKVTVTLGPPVDDQGRPVKVARGADTEP